MRKRDEEGRVNEGREKKNRRGKSEFSRGGGEKYRYPDLYTQNPDEKARNKIKIVFGRNT